MAKASDALKLALGKPDFAGIDPTKKNYSRELFKATFYVHNVIDTKVRKKEVITYAKTHLPDIDIKLLQKLSDGAYESIGKFCYVYNFGGKLADKEIAGIERVLTEMVVTAQAKTEADELRQISDDADDAVAKKPQKVVGIQDYMRERASEVCGELEQVFDDYCADPANYKLALDPKNVFIAAKLKAGHLRYVVKFYTPMVNELTEASEGDDNELREAYGFLTKPQLRKFAVYVQSIIDAANFLKNASVTSRKPRKKRAVDISKLVSKLKHKADEDGVKSVNPIHIVGASGVWVYNVRTRKIGYYEAFDGDGLTVKGTSIKNFSDKSVERTIRKNIEFDIKKFAGANKSSRKRTYKEFKSMETKLKGRLNEHTLILSVDK